MMHSEPRKASDTECLFHFVETGHQTAFAELVRRHGPMVTATIRRVLARHDHIEDARQATFFALAKSAHKLRRMSAIAGWLHKTAYRCALEVRRAEARQERITKRIGEETSTMSTSRKEDPSRFAANAELERVLDDELSKLPTKMIATIVLCDIEGMTQKEAASRLGIPIRTFRDHLAKGRKQLRDRLRRRGVTLVGLGVCLGATRKASAEMTEEVIADITTKSALFAAGKSAAELGVASSVCDAANKVARSITIAKMTAIGVATLAIVAATGPLVALKGSISNNKASATTLHYWRFEDDPGFLIDSIAGVSLEQFDMDPVALRSNGRGADFPSFVGGYGPNRSAAAATGHPAGGLANNTATVDEAFTIELFAHFDSLAGAGNAQRSMLAAQSNFPRVGNDGLSWALGVERSGGFARPRELTLWADNAEQDWEQVASGIFLEEDTDYFLSAAFDADAGEVRFYVKSLSTGETQMETIGHSLTKLHRESTFGVMWPEGWSRVDGIVDEVRFSRGVVSVDELLVNLPKDD